MHVVVAGGSAAGSMTALLLARAGHQVTLLEADDLPVEDDVEAAAASCFRRAVPQVVQPHAALPRFRELLKEHLHDVYVALLQAGVVEAPLSSQLPPTLQDREPRPGDERITLLLLRRSTLDWVLRRAVLQESGVQVRERVRVRGLLGGRGPHPRVCGVSTDRGQVLADFVVDCTGRRSLIDTWLSRIDAAPPENSSAECGLAYYARHYRVRGDVAPPGPPTTRLLLALDQLTAGLWSGDNGSVAIALAPLAADHRYKTAGEPRVHEAVLRTLPQLAAWIDALEPTGPVHPMGGLRNSLRQLRNRGAPIATGLAAVGDSTCTTNPTFGRGLSLALIGAVDLVSALGEHLDEPEVLAERVAFGVETLIKPFYVDQARNDAERLSQLRHHVYGEPLSAARTDQSRVTFAELRTAMPHDPTLVRAFWQVMGTLQDPENVYTDPDVVQRTRSVLASSA